MVSTEYANAQGTVLYASDVSKMGELLDVSTLSLKEKRTCYTVYNEQGHDEVMVVNSLMDVGWYCIRKIQL